ncbi:hypothetical protein NMY22_g2274 [Coprinellus aureogranulatus]|nr:hypothetical protein NMY22_g2274 [Coprinellus aureogranulatus]
MDFDSGELSDRPWEMSLQDIPSTHRLHFLKAACRGLMQDQNYMPVVRTVSAYILCTRIAKATLAASHAARSRWADEGKRTGTYGLAAKYINELYGVQEAAWEEMVGDSARGMLRLGGHEIAGSRATVLENLVDSLKHPNPRLRIHAIKMLKSYARALCPRGEVETEQSPFLVQGVATESISAIAHMVVYDDDQDVRHDGLGLFVALLESHGPGEIPLRIKQLHESIEAALTEAVKSGLSTYEDRLLTSSVQLAERLSEFAPDTRLGSIVSRVVPWLIKVALDNASPQRASRLAVELLQKLSANPKSRLKGEVKRGVFEYREQQISDSQSKSRSTFLEALQCLFHSNEFAQDDDHLPMESLIWDTTNAFLKEIVRKTYKVIVNVAISEEHAPGREAAQKILALMAHADYFNDLKQTIMEQLLTFTNNPSSTWWVRLSAVAAMEVFAQQASVNLPTELVRGFLKLALKDGHAKVRETALKAVRNLFENNEATERFSETMRDVLIEGLRDGMIASETYDHIKAGWVPFLSSIAKRVSFPQAVPFCIERAIMAPHGADINISVMELLKSDGFARGAFAAPPFVQFTRVTVTLVASPDPECVHAFKGAVPPSLLGEGSLDSCNWIKILLELLPEDSGNPNPIQEIAIQALATVKEDVKRCIVNGYSEKVGDIYRSAPVGDTHSLAKSFISDALQQILGKIPSKGRTHWSRALYKWSLPILDELPDAHKIIVQLAVHDPDSDVRVTSMKWLNRLAERGTTRSRLLADADVVANVEIMAQDKWWAARLVAFQLHARIQDVGFPYAGKIFNLALKGDAGVVRDKATGLLVQLLKDDDCDTMAADVAKRLAASIANTEDRQMAKLLLRRLTGPSAYHGGQLDTDNITPWEEVWIQVVMPLGEDQHLPVADIILTEIQRAKHGEHSQSKPRRQIEKLPKSTLSELPPHIYSSLKSDRLEDLGQDSEAGSFLICSHDEELVTQWSQIALKDADSRLRVATLNFLKSLILTDRFHNLIKSSLGKAVKNSIENQESTKVVKDAIEALHGLTKVYSHEYCKRLKDIVSPSIPHLMRITMRAGWGHDEVREEAKVILLEDLTRFSEELQVTAEVLDSLPAMIPDLTEDGKVVALQLVESLHFTDETATSFAKGLTPLLTASYSSFSRGVALSLLSKLHSKHISSNHRLVACLTSATQEITALALDERDEVSGARATAIQLLAALCRTRKDGTSKDSVPPQNPVTKLTHLLDQFMNLLQNESLRPSVVELLSMMSADSEVRRRISLEIITLALGKEGKDIRVLQGNAALLARLISDGRFEDKATDNAVLFLASTMLTRPELLPYRFEISTGLWCRYRGRDFTDIAPSSDSDPSDDFVGLFILALFGGHVSEEEVNPFLERGQEWVSQNESATKAYEEGKVSALGSTPRLDAAGEITSGSAPTLRPTAATGSPSLV